MRVLYGMYPADEGRIVVNGEEVKIASPRVGDRARASGWSTSTSCWWIRSRSRRTSSSATRGGAILDMDAAQRAGRRRSRRRTASRSRPSARRRRPLRRRGAARRDPEGAVSGRRPADPRRAHRGPHAGGGEGAVREPPAPARRRARRSCSSATNSTRSWTSPTGSRCCGAGTSSARPARRRHQGQARRDDGRAAPCCSGSRSRTWRSASRCSRSTGSWARASSNGI